MRTYKNLSGDSAIVTYEIGKTFIKLKFSGGDVYTYNYKIPGKKEVEHMKSLALNGRGLGTYITEFVRNNYAFKG
jgi:hypothetical protein